MLLITGCGLGMTWSPLGIRRVPSTTVVAGPPIPA